MSGGKYVLPWVDGFVFTGGRYVGGEGGRVTGGDGGEGGRVIGGCVTGGEGGKYVGPVGGGRVGGGCGDGGRLGEGGR